MPYIDTHCHIDLYPGYETVIAQLEEARVATIAVTNTPSVFHATKRLAQDRRYLRAALGLHPELAAQRYAELGLFKELVGETRFIGEVGLDFVTGDAGTRARQTQVFAAILEACATYGDKVLTVHSRRAAAEVVAMVGQSYPGAVVLHWFSGSKKVVEMALANGCYFSVNAAMVGAKSSHGLIQAIPDDRLLTETDGPFVLVNGRPSLPTDIPSVVDGMALLRGVSSETLADICYSNFRRLLRSRDSAV